MRQVIPLVVSIFLLATPVLASLGIAKTTLYVPSIPRILDLELQETNNGLTCSWIIADWDTKDKFDTTVTWNNNGEIFTTDNPHCNENKPCSSKIRTEPALYDVWTCDVHVIDSYDLSADQSTSLDFEPEGITGLLLAGSSIVSDFFFSLFSLF